jgi:ribosome biogenesis GTPase
VVERVEARRTVLSRRDFRGREHALVANADQLLIVVSVAEPRFRPHLVDRYIVAALKGRLRPVICVNKIDLLDAGSVTDAESDAQGGGSTAAALDELAALGYDCLRTSATSGAGLAALRDALRDRVTALSGQSGVGKSSLLNAVQPGLGLSTRAVSTETEKGRHTTTHAELLRLEVGGYVADTPGVRAWDLWGVAREELEALFEEFVPFVPQCRYKNCLHRDEDGCAVRAAAQAGAISARRYFSYVKMLDEV